MSCNSFWLDLTPTGNGDTQTSFCTYAGDYNTFTANVGYTYTFSVCGGSYNSAITMYTNSGVLLYSQNSTSGNGCETWTWTATVSGVVRLLVDKANCGTNSTCTSVDITQISGGGGTTGNQNCSTPTQVCSDASFTGNSNGFGIQNLNSTNQGCLSTEHQSSWYTFQAVTSGSISLTIVTSVDYDFAIWGPNTTCASLVTPIRCSFAAGGGNTGLGNGATDNSESAFGDRWVAPLVVTAGESYIMLIDNFTSNSTVFTIDWTMSGGATLNCSTLPIELISFDGYKYDDYNLLTWVSATELNNDYYRLEKSTDAINWETAYIADGSGTSYTPIHYQYKDYNYKTSEIIYYRLVQVDLNGNSEIFNIVSIDRTHNKSERKLVKVTNILGQEVDPETDGVLIYQYSDGSYDKNYKIK